MPGPVAGSSPEAEPGPGAKPEAAADAGSAEGSGVILRNCLFIERSRKTSTTPMPATTRKPSTPGSTSLIDEEVAEHTERHRLTLSLTPANRSSSGRSVSTTDLAR